MSSVKLAVAIIGAIGSCVVGAVGTAVYKDNKHNKEKKQWQDEKQQLLNKISSYQSQLANREARIQVLQSEIRTYQNKLARANKNLRETDEMIMILNQRQNELKKAKSDKEYYSREINKLRERVKYA